MDINELPLELLEKAKACKSTEELSALCAEAGIELSEEDLNTLAGGISCKDFSICKIVFGLYTPTCPDALF